MKRQTPFRPTAWRAHRREPWRVGWGHVGPEVTEDSVVERTEADALLRADLEAWAEKLGPFSARRRFHRDALIVQAFRLGRMPDKTDKMTVVESQLSKAETAA